MKDELSVDYWKERLEAIFANRVQIEREIASAIGVDELSSEQIFKLRKACSALEFNEEAIERTQMQIKYWSSKNA